MKVYLFGVLVLLTLIVIVACRLEPRESESGLSPITVPVTDYPSPVEAAQNLGATSILPTPTPDCNCEVVVTPTPVIPQETPREAMRVRPTCERSGMWTKCSDDLLDLEFQYPSSWGEIEAKLHRGLTSGYGYDYAFTGLDEAQRTVALAGGRSIDYVEGRGGTIQDFYGFEGRSSEQVCREGASVCKIIQPGVILSFHFVDAKFVCEFNQGLLFHPFATVDVNLPSHNLINGFRFVARFLSAPQEQALFGLLEIDKDNQPKNCSAEARQAFDAEIARLNEQLRTGIGDSETIVNTQVLHQFAEYISGKNVGE